MRMHFVWPLCNDGDDDDDDNDGMGNVHLRWITQNDLQKKYREYFE